MEALYFLKFWKSVAQNGDHHRPSSVVGTDCYEFEEVEEDDSFFELELTVPDFDNNKCYQCPLETDSDRFDNKDQNLRHSAGNSELKFQPQSASLFPTDPLSKRKILPIESPSNKPQSPISHLKSAPRFQVLMFKKSKSMVAHETDLKGGFVDNDNGRSKKRESKLFTVKFKLKEVANVPIFTRDNSLRRQVSEDSLSEDSSKLFSKELMHKYLKLIKPLYIKVSRKQREKTKFSGDLSAASPSYSPATGSPKREKQGSIPAGIRVVCKHLGKSKSASATAASTTATPSTVSRRDDSLLLQHDGIQSAILHCKKSFNSFSSGDSSL